MNKTSQAASHLGRLGGQKSAEKRFSGKTKEERSALMRKVRMTPEEKKEFEAGLPGMVENLNKNTAQ